MINSINSVISHGCLLLMVVAVTVYAGEADIEQAEADCTEQLLCDFSVTVRHADAGWDHYANRWEVLGIDNKLLATRVLAHPHDNEQPFTRSLRAIQLPAGTVEVIIRANDSVHKLGGRAMRLPITAGQSTSNP